MYKFILKNNKPISAVCEVAYEQNRESLRIPFDAMAKAQNHAAHLASLGMSAQILPLAPPPEALIEALSGKTFAGRQPLSDFIASWMAETLPPDPVELINAILGV